MGQFTTQAQGLERRAEAIRAALPVTAKAFPTIGQTAQLITELCALVSVMAARLDDQGGGNA